MSDKYILDEKGNLKAVDLLTWAKWLETANTQIEETNIGKVRVSTVFLGLEHGFKDGKPLIFETMIFGGKYDQYQDRYSSKEEAIIGHKKAVDLI